MATPLARQNSRTCFCSPRDIIQPVGFPGVEMKIAFVFALQAEKSSSRSSFQCGCSACQLALRRTKRVSAPAISPAWKMNGHTGEMTTILSPFSITHWSAVTMQSIAAPGTVIRSIAMSASLVRLWKALIASRNARSPRPAA